jgi:hypothetical protein
VFRADDRVLLLAIPGIQELAVLSRVLINGTAVILGTRDELEPVRHSMAEFGNVLLLEADPNRIPWRSAYFTKIVVPPHLERLLPHISSELDRVLAPGGEIVRSTIAA